ncbi:hypothetical protein [Streptomyces alboflavus]|uniref:hypothetical protein n=1 Tax=Streptomyces alboflavus TaxID=67267 RepID=UPI003673C35E
MLKPFTVINGLWDCIGDGADARTPLAVLDGHHEPVLLLGDEICGEYAHVEATDAEAAVRIAQQS